jgi:hypothetical protein
VENSFGIPAACEIWALLAIRLTNHVNRLSGSLPAITILAVRHRQSGEAVSPPPDF